MSPEEKLFSRLRGVIDDGPGKWKGCCPIHKGGNEQNPSLGIEKGTDGKLLLHCFVCGSGVKAAEFCMAVGLSQSDLYPEDLERHGKSRKKSKIPPGAKKIAEFFYRDEDGAILYRTDRWEWTNERGEREKTFEQRRPNGSGGFIPGVKRVRKVLYRLPELLASDVSRVVFLVEGEKKAEALVAWDQIATSIVGGANGKWVTSYTDSLCGRHVVILPDNDPMNESTGDCVGKDFAVRVLGVLKDVAASVHILELPGLPPKGDICDWQAAGHSRDEFLALVAKLSDEETKAAIEKHKADQAAAPGRDPTSTHFEEKILVDLQLDVLGELENRNGFVKVFSESHRKSDVIDIRKLDYNLLMLLAGPIVKAKVNQSNEDVDGMHTLAQVKRAISLMAGFRRISDETEVGVGCWQGQDNEGEYHNSIVAVGAGESAKWNGSQILERVTKPRVGGRLLDIGSSEPWYDFSTLSAMLAGCTPEWAFSVVNEAEALFQKWKWRHPESPLVVTGLILATWIQTIWAWRPQVAIVGKSNTGKSTLFMALEAMFGRLAVKSSKSSAAGIRQSIKRSAKVVLADEFESGRHRNDILEMLRASGRGDRVLRGSTGHKGQEFTMRHICWVAAIENGLRREPDRNRFITLELVPPDKEMAGKLVLPPVAELAALGQKLLAVAIKFGLAAQEIAADLKGRQFESVHQRVVESYAVPAAIVASLLGKSGGDAATIARMMMKTVDASESDVGDEDSLLEDILSSIIRLDRGDQATVSQIIRTRKVNMESEATLERVGVGIFEGYDDVINGQRIQGDFAFFAHAAIVRQLLARTPWETQNIDQILCRIPGAIKTRKRIAGTRPWGVMIPMSLIDIQEHHVGSQAASPTPQESLW